LSYKGINWPVLQESNPHLYVRSVESYPLNEGPYFGADPW
jgi:hypothetical protein